MLAYIMLSKHWHILCLGATLQLVLDYPCTPTGSMVFVGPTMAQELILPFNQELPQGKPGICEYHGTYQGKCPRHPRYCWCEEDGTPVGEIPVFMWNKQHAKQQLDRYGESECSRSCVIAARAYIPDGEVELEPTHEPGCGGIAI